jgi:hypothetical protein
MSADVRERPDFDLDEDLFDFASVEAESESAESGEDLEEIFASFRETAPSEELLSVPSAGEPAPAPEVEPDEPPAEFLLEPAPASLARESPSAGDAQALLAPATRPARVSRGVLAIALSVTVLNSLLAVIVLRSGRFTRDEAGVAQAAQNDGGEDRTAAELAPSLPSVAERPAELLDHPALELARTEISRGEHAAARQRLYSVLAIIDRTENPRRSALEAECRFLIAQSLHMEALERAGHAQ